MSSWILTVNGKEYKITSDGSNFSLNGSAIVIDIAEILANEFHIIYNKRSYSVAIAPSPIGEKIIIATVNGRDYEVNVQDKFDLLLQQLGMSAMANVAIKDLKAPMPGKVLRLDVHVGQQLTKGDQVLILEAMKMENAIKSPGEGIVKNILVKEGDAVEKNMILLEFE